MISYKEVQALAGYTTLVYELHEVLSDLEKCILLDEIFSNIISKICENPSEPTTTYKNCSTRIFD